MSYRLIITPAAQADIRYWNKNNPKKSDRIFKLLEDIQNSPYSGIGKPEALKHDWSGYWSRRIDREHRLIYRVREGNLEIIRCRFHY